MDDSLEKIAEENRTSPMELYRIMKPLETRVVPAEGIEAYTTEMIEEKFAGTGIGQKNIDQVSRELGINMAVFSERLEDKGIVFEKKERLKDTAARYDMNPLDLLKIIAVQSSPGFPMHRGQVFL